MNTVSPQLRITEIFYSLQGESSRIGLPTVFIRLTGCPLRCQYCDTTYAFHGGNKLSIEDILTEVRTYQTPYICVTGGEPLAQPACLTLLQALCDDNYQVSLETSGAIDCSAVDPRVMIIMDLKTPDSLESEKNKLTNLDYLKPTDQIKFVLCSRLDYEWACQMILDHKLTARAEILFSPSYQQLEPRLLADWIIQDQLLVRFQLQLHKLLWNDVPGH
jgi:7-carboxy-7-deazaguanine synthase